MKGVRLSFARIHPAAGRRLRVAVLLAFSIVLNLVSGAYSGYTHAHKHDHIAYHAHDHEHDHADDRNSERDLPAAITHDERAADALVAFGSPGGEVHEHGPEIVLIDGAIMSSEVPQLPQSWQLAPGHLYPTAGFSGLERPPRA